MKYVLSSFVSNFVAILAADYFIAGFSVEPTAQGFLIVTGLLTLINLVIRPFLRLILTPLIILTFGFFSIVINGALLYALDIFSSQLIIEGLEALIYSTLLITAINVILNFTLRRSRK